MLSVPTVELNDSLERESREGSCQTLLFLRFGEDQKNIINEEHVDTKKLEIVECVHDVLLKTECTLLERS